MHTRRRDFLKLAGFAAAVGTTGLSFSAHAKAKIPHMGRVVVIGGGYAGATAAKYLRMWSMGAIEVVVIEPSQQFVSCPLSNLVLGGSKSIDELTFGYDMLKANHGIDWVQDQVTAIM
jgi:NADH dehydrogenase FAD-containing subunit